MCDSGNERPTWILDSEGRWKVVGVDECLSPLVHLMNRNGIKTLSSCCGHDPGGVPGGILVDPDCVRVFWVDGVMRFELLVRTQEFAETMAEEVSNNMTDEIDFVKERE